mmetsp:Transcript_79029/g.152667  ORF Transcript_79029/g.152667 Transcript_79029/m.152667 type:complete len:90 (-) Transcript_79029:49-318(-)
MPEGIQLQGLPEKRRSERAHSSLPHSWVERRLSNQPQSFGLVCSRQHCDHCTSQLLSQKSVVCCSADKISNMAGHFDCTRLFGFRIMGA